MSGWVKFEKDLETDPRTQRVAKAIAAHLSMSDGSNACALLAVTLVCGALTRLWIYADSHIRSDDTLGAGVDALDEWIGIRGFCAMLPPDWLIVIDENNVELPGFQSHNGVVAKKTAQTQKRVSNHRTRQALKDRNAGALPDQTRPDHITYIAPGQNSETEIRKHIDAIKADYPPPARADWITGEKRARQLVLNGEATWTQLRDGTKRYRAHCSATGRIPLNPARFFGDVDRPWSQAWALPDPKPRADYRTPAPNHDAMWADAKSRAKTIGFREPYSSESADVYMTEVKLAENRPPRRSDAVGTAIRETVQKMRAGTA